MSHPPNSRPRSTLLNQSQSATAVIIACVITFFIHPYAFDASVQFVTSFGETHYGLGWAIPTLWWLLTFSGIVSLLCIVIRVLTSGSVFSAFIRIARGRTY